MLKISLFLSPPTQENCFKYKNCQTTSQLIGSSEQVLRHLTATASAGLCFSVGVTYVRSVTVIGGDADIAAERAALVNCDPDDIVVPFWGDGGPTVN